MPVLNVKKIFRVLALMLIAMSLSGCLTCERKEYTFQLTGENSGKLTIKYVNIFSSLIDSTDELSSDYDEMVNLWLKGEKLEKDFPHAINFKKRLFAEDGVLCGEVVMEFDDLSKVNLYRFQDTGPYMFSLSGVNDDGETFLQTNGAFGGEKMPVIFWNEDIRSLRFSTNIAEPDSSCVSMLQQWETKQEAYQKRDLKQLLTFPDWHQMKETIENKATYFKIKGSNFLQKP